MRIVVFGGDGFCGWPTSLHLSARGHDVLIVDNLARRAIDVELAVSSLTPIALISTRLEAWAEVSGRIIRHLNVDVAKEFYPIVDLLKESRPDAVIHFAEQRAAPYSMKSERHKRYTVENNIAATHNILCAIVESGLDIHIVHLGTMGVYGYGGGAAIPEGYLQVEILGADGRRTSREILHPADPGSIYHMTKTLDQLLFYYYNKNDRVRVTDLHQGVVWGTNTRETKSDPRLINRFDYDGDYGTVLNRFLMQAAIGYPLTVHGKGGQTRAFIHIADTVRCIELALLNPPTRNRRVQIFNQMTETHRVRDLAELVARLTGARIEYLPNPRNEAPENDLIVEAKSLVELGLKPTCLERGLLEEVMDIRSRDG
jgi:UDP-sulfoquinovose synthase